MGSIDDVSIFSHRSLRTQLATKELGGIWLSARDRVSGTDKDVQVGGRARALATSSMFGMTVLIPLPRPSILVFITGILYRYMVRTDSGSPSQVKTYVKLVGVASDNVDGRHFE